MTNVAVKVTVEDQGGNFCPHLEARQVDPPSSFEIFVTPFNHYTAHTFWVHEGDLPYGWQWEDDGCFMCWRVVVG